MRTHESYSVPSDIHYISDWEDFQNINLRGHVIVNKKYTGCGMTSYYLWNNMPVILAAPRKMLLENKMKQQKADRPTLFYYEVPKDCNADTHKKLFLKTCEYINNQLCLGQPPKILVTYKSFSKVCDALLGCGIPFQVVVDEFHVITQDIEMDPGSTITFLRYLQQLPDVIYLTATPESEQDLSKIRDFQSMRYVELDWPNIKTAAIRPVRMVNTRTACGEIIQSYRQKGYFERKGDVFAREAVFYINDVSDIMAIIKKNGLVPEETNILVSTSDPNNESKLNRLNSDTEKKFTMGTIPKEGECHKTFTFCSRVVFYGCDFYSTNAYTYVFADANRDNRRIDIALDLPQIMGRQRRDDNVFKYEAILFVKTTSLKELESEEVFRNEQNMKIATSIRDSFNYNMVPAESRIGLGIQYPKSNYIVKYLDNGEYKFECNDIRILSDEKAWREKNKYYRSTSTIMMNLFDSSFVVKPQDNQILQNFLNCFLQIGEWRDRMRCYCDFLQQYPEYREEVRNLTWIPEEFHYYYDELGYERIRANSYQQSRLKEELFPTSLEDYKKHLFLSTFHVGDRIVMDDVKEKIRQIYNKLGVSKAAKATDLSHYFKYKNTSIRVAGKKCHAFEITGLSID